MKKPATLDERAPHKATRAVVDAKREELVRELYQAFDEHNRAYFAGELSAPLLLVAATSSPRALGDHCDRDEHGLRSVIRVHPRAFRRGALFAKDVLLHEMVHVWQGEVLGDLEDAYRGHGPRFAEKCNLIGETLGLAAVGVKGRKGLPDCARWPLNVRPGGYYPPEPPKKGKPKKDKGGGDVAGDVAGDGEGEGAPARRPGDDEERIALLCLRASKKEKGALRRALRRAADYFRFRAYEATREAAS
jgi:hypothetical protein